LAAITKAREYSGRPTLTARTYHRAPDWRRLTVVLLFCACGHRNREAPAATYGSALSAFRNGDYKEASARAAQAAGLCGADAPCRAKCRLQEAESLIQLAEDSKAAALLSQNFPNRPDFSALELRRRMLQGFLFNFSDDKIKALAGRNLLDGAYQEAVRTGQRDLLPEMENYEGSVQHRIGNTVKEREYFIAAKQHALEQQDLYNLSAACNNLALNSLKRERYDEAMALFEQALESGKRVPAPQTVGIAYSNQAVCYTNLGDYDRAIQARQEALTWLVGNQSPVLRSNLYGEMGRTLELQGDPGKAIEYYRKALEPKGLSKDDIRRWTGSLASALAGIGNWDAAEKANRDESAYSESQATKAYANLNAATIAAGRKQFDQAARLYRQALDSKVGEAAVLWEANAGLARIYAKLGNPRLARTYFEKTIQIIDKNQEGLARDEYELTFLASLIRFYQDYVEYLMRSGDPDRALEVVESSRARILTETTHLNGAAAPKPANLPNAGALRDAARRSGRIYLSYWLAPAESYVWVVTPAGIQHFPLGPAQSIESLVDAFQQGIKSWDLMAAQSAAANRLSAALIGPVAALIPAQAHVVIVPDGACHFAN
jgi:tetratricopeptide (TPR) repeat protein